MVPLSLFCENSFANCDHTTGSLTSMLTGRLPTETRVTYPPDILTGDQAYRRLPGLLKQLGYFSEQICIRHYGDAFDVNMREGFDRAAFRDRDTAQGSSRLVRWVGQEAGLFVTTITGRIAVRLAHTAGLGKLPSAFQEAVHADHLTGHTDAERFTGLVETLNNAPTIAGFLGLEVPDWMHGQSLLGDSSDSLRPVFSTGFRGDHTAPLPETDLTSALTASATLVDHLTEHGWDVTGLPDPLPTESPQ